MQPLDVTIQGQALNDFGLSALNTIAGLGLNTFGFLWGCPDIWVDSDAALTTTWANSDTGGIEYCND